MHLDQILAWNNEYYHLPYIHPVSIGTTYNEPDESEEVIVKNKKHINEWVRGISKMEADKITAELNIINDLGIDRNALLTCSAEGCAHEYETKIEYNPSNFFDLSS